MQMSSNISLLFKVKKPGFHIPEKRPQIPDILLYDIRSFARVHPELSNRQAAEAFLNKWAGYKARYSLELVTAGPLTEDFYEEDDLSGKVSKETKLILKKKKMRNNYV